MTEKIRKDGKPYRKPGPKSKKDLIDHATKNPIVRSPRNARAIIQAKPNNDLAREEILLSILSGTWNPRMIYEISQKYQAGIQWVRGLAEQAFQLVRMLQSYSDDPVEQRLIIRSDIDQKLQSIYELATQKQDYKTCNQILLSIGKLHNIFDPDKIEIVNSPVSALTPDELRAIRETGKLPDSIIQDWRFTESTKEPNV